MKNCGTDNGSLKSKQLKKIFITIRTVLISASLVFLLVLSGCGNSQEAPAASESPSESTQETIAIETAKTGDVSMNYFKFGSGEKTLVIIPGLSAQGVMGAAEQIASSYQVLKDDFTIYVFDPQIELPEDIDISGIAENTAEIIKTIGLDHIYIMGASMGGMMAMEIAANHPELIEKMVLASTALQMKEPQFHELDKWISLAQQKDAEALYLAFGEAIYPKEIFEQSRDALAEASKTVTEDEMKRFVILAESMRGFDITNDLDKIECPVLAVNDSEDNVLGNEAVSTMEKYMSQRNGWEFYMYDGYGHALYDTAPDFKERMLGFFLR